LQLGTEGGLGLNEHDAPAQELQTEFVGPEGHLMHGAQRDDRGADSREEQAMRGYGGQGMEGVRGGPPALSAGYQHAASREHELGSGDLGASQRDLHGSWDALPAGAQRRPSWGGGYLAAGGEAQMAACESRDWGGHQGGLQASRMMQGGGLMGGRGHGFGTGHGYRESIADAAREAALREFEEGRGSGGYPAGSMAHEYLMGGQQRSSYSTGMGGHLQMTSAPMAHQQQQPQKQHQHQHKKQQQQQQQQQQQHHQQQHHQQQQHQQPPQQQMITASRYMVAGGAMAPGHLLHHAAAMQGAMRAGDMVGRGGVGMGYGMRDSMDGGNGSGGVPANKRARLESASAD